MSQYVGKHVSKSMRQSIKALCAAVPLFVILATLIVVPPVAAEEGLGTTGSAGTIGATGATGGTGATGPTGVVDTSCDFSVLTPGAITAPIQTEFPDYLPGASVNLSGSGFGADEVVCIKVTEDNPTETWTLKDTTNADSGGNVAYSFSLSRDFIAQYRVRAWGLTSGMYAETTFTDAPASLANDFQQCANFDPSSPISPQEEACHWITSILQGGNSDYVEGMVVPQRVVLPAVPASVGNLHTLFFSHQATKSGDAHAYDFVSSWDDAIQTAVALGGFSDLDLNVCGVAISATAQTACNQVVTGDSNPVPAAGAFTAQVPVPGDNYVSQIFTIGDGDYQDRINAYEADFGPRYIEIFGNAPITSATLSLSHTKVAPDDDGGPGDDDIEYTLNWQSASTIIVVAYGGHLAVGFDGSGVSWGEGVGSSAISGGPYHQFLNGYEFFDPTEVQNPDKPEFISLGKQDNQIKAADILAPGFKSGYKFEDLDGDGVWDPGEPGLNGWDIKLYRDLNLNSIPEAGELIQSVQTANDDNGNPGYYEFFPIQPDDDDTAADEGKYIVCETLKSGFAQTYPKANSTPPTGTTPSGGTVNETIVGCGTNQFGYRFDVSDGEVYDDNDFGNRGSGTKEGFKYEDKNANGNFDGNDVKLPGWTIYAIPDLAGGTQDEIDAADVVARQTTTTADGGGSLALGAYKFTLTAGTWFVCEKAQWGAPNTPAAGWSQSSPQSVDTGYTTECGDTDAAGLGLAGAGYKITVSGGSTDIDNEFGNYQSGIKSGFKYEDKNADSDKNGTDTNITGWPIYAIKDLGAQGELEAADALTEIHQNTDASGNYSFSLAPGTYFICEAAQKPTESGWAQSSPKTGDTHFTDECGDTDAASLGLATGGYYITVTSQSSETGNEFGNYKSGIKSGFKYEDKNADSDKNGTDTNITGWPIYAIKDLGAQGELEAADALTEIHQNTDASGNYSFSLAPGTYFICEAAQKPTESGWAQSSPKTGDTHFTDECGDTDAASLGLATGGYYITVTSQSSETGNEFGNYKSGIKSGFKYEDKNADSDKNGTDTNITGWPIYAIKDLGAQGELEAADALTEIHQNTDASGNYSFSLAPGTYFICEAAQKPTESGWAQSSPKTGDTHFTDECGDTDAASLGLATGGYYITVTSQSSETGNEFGNYKSGIKSGFKYEDKNADSDKNGTDTNITGWPIYAIKDLGAQGELEAADALTEIHQNTDASGNYSFSLAPGTYFICEAAQKPTESGWAQSSPKTGDTHFTDECGDTDAASLGLATGGYYITVTSQSSETGNEFGNYKSGIKSGFKYEDKNADSDKNGTDTNITGWPIYAIKDLGAQGELEAADALTEIHQNTDASGNYSFSLAPGTYFICEAAQKPTESGWAQSSPKTGDTHFTDECGDTDAASLGLATGGYYITVTSQSSETGNEFGNYKSGIKSGFKYEDKNADSDKNGTDTNITGWPIYAIKDLGAQGELEAADALTEIHQNTDASGNYSFSLAPGTYFICEAAQKPTESGWAQSSPKTGDTHFTDECGDTDAASLGLATGGYYITVTSQSSETGNEFGNYKSGIKSGFKYEDKNADSDKNGTDTNITGWPIYAIKDLGAQGELEAADALTEIHQNTDASGNYSFSLAPGTYFICEAAQKPTESGWAQSSPKTGDTHFTDECGDTDAASLGLATGGYYITVTSQSSETGNEFGNYKSGIKSGFKYEDKNADSDKNGTDTNITGWPIYAIKDLGAQGELEAADALTEIHQNTDASGNYSFSLAPGTYFICEAAQKPTESGWAQSSPKTGDTHFTDECGDTDAASLGLATGGYYITVTSQSSETGNEFGNYKSGIKSGFKYEDKNADSDKNGTDTNITGWPIYAIKDLGAQGELEAADALTEIHQNTDASGNYSFSLAPGTYFICEAAQKPTESGWAQSSPKTGDTHFTDECGDTDAASLGLATGGYYITVTSQSSETGNEFGNYRQGTKSGIKFESEDGAGPFESGEDSPVAGWKIYLYADDGDGTVEALEKTPVGSTTTDADDGNADGLGFGEYKFTLNPGTYVVCEAAEDSDANTTWVQSFPTAPEVTNEANCALAEDDGGTPSAANVANVGYKFTITSGSSETNNDFGNYRPVKVKVTKTVNGGPIPEGVTFTFKIRKDATTDPNGSNGGFGTLIASGNATSSDNTVGPDDWNVVSGQTYPLAPGTYQLCEVIVNGFTPDFVLNGTYGTGSGQWFQPGIQQAPGDQVAENSEVCFTFTVSSGDGGEDQTVEYAIDNSPPGMARTIGYWKNWTSCDGGGNQAPTLDTVIATNATDNWTPTNGEPTAAPDGQRDIRLGDLVIQDNPSTPVNEACTLAVDILDKRLIGNVGVVGDGKKIASSPAWNAGSQLLAYELNQLNGATGCAAADTAAGYTRRILNKIGFRGTSDPIMSKAEKDALNFYAGILDDFNNNTLICSTSVPQLPGVPLNNIYLP